MAWEPLETAPKDGSDVLAQDADGFVRWTKFEFGDWVYNGWCENADQEEFECEQVWEPTSWDNPAK